MNRSGALKLTAILVVLVLCVSSVGIGLQLASKGTSSVNSVDASTAPAGEKPLNTGENSSIPGQSSRDSNDLQLLNNKYFGGDSPQLFMSGNQDCRALYGSDCNYSRNSTSTKTVDPATVNVIVGPSESSTVTLLSTESISLGDFVYDTATVIGQVGSPMPTGNVTFEVMVPGTAIFVPFGVSGPIALDAAGQAVSKDYYPEMAGTYYFLAVYSGDANYLGGQSPVDSERLDVGKAPTSTSTTLFADEPFILGDTVYDYAEVIALNGTQPIPTGSVTFQVSADNGATWEQIGSPVDLVDGKAYSELYTPQAPGHYEFQAVYSGDDIYLASESMIGDEPLFVGKFLKAHTTTTTCLGTYSTTLGQSVMDNATVTGIEGSSVLTGTVTFYVSADGGCSWTMVGAGPVALDANGKAMSDWYMPLEAGDYLFKAVYSGDSNYLPSESDPCSEPLHVDGSIICPA